MDQFLQSNTLCKSTIFPLHWRYRIIHVPLNFIAYLFLIINIYIELDVDCFFSLYIFRMYRPKRWSAAEHSSFRMSMPMTLYTPTVLSTDSSLCNLCFLFLLVCIVVCPSFLRILFTSKRWEYATEFQTIMLVLLVFTKLLHW